MMDEDGQGECPKCGGGDEDCEVCAGANRCPECDGGGECTACGGTGQRSP